MGVVSNYRAGRELKLMWRNWSRQDTHLGIDNDYCNHNCLTNLSLNIPADVKSLLPQQPIPEDSLMLVRTNSKSFPLELLSTVLILISVVAQIKSV
jgi:hypothetical protein